MFEAIRRSNFFRSYGFWHVGEGFQTVLLTWYMAFYADLSASEIGFYQALQLLPFLAFTMIGGSLADRIGARLSFAAATGLFAFLLSAYAMLLPLLGFQPWLFGGYCLLSGVLSAISNPAIDTFIPEATPRPATDNALIAGTVHNVAKLLGNVTTLLLPLLQAAGGFAVNGILMALSVVFLLRHPRPPRPARAAVREHALLRVRAHFRNHPQSFDIFLGSVMLGTFIIPGFYIFTPLVMRGSFTQYEDFYGVVSVMGWFGAISASSLALRLAPRITRPGRVALSVWGASAFAFLALGVVSSFAGLLLVRFLLGGNTLGKTLVYGHYLHDAPQADRGLLIGMDQTAFWGLATFGTLILGWLVDQIGFQAALLLNSGCILGFVMLLGLRGQLWRIGSLQ